MQNLKEMSHLLIFFDQIINKYLYNKKSSSQTIYMFIQTAFSHYRTEYKQYYY